MTNHQEGSPLRHDRLETTRHTVMIFDMQPPIARTRGGCASLQACGVRQVVKFRQECGASSSSHLRTIAVRVDARYEPVY